MGDNDSDGDGVADMNDICPNTLEGVAVTTKGCPWDTDGDGVPDYLDHQLITPTECQPVDSLGRGMCPCPCENQSSAICDFKFKTEWVGFSHLSYQIDSNGIKAIERFARQMRSNPSFTVKIVGYTNGESAANAQASWSRVFEVRQNLIEQFGIDKDRILMQPNELGQLYLVKLSGLLKNDYKNLRPGVVPPFFPGFIDEKNKRIKYFKR